MIIELAIPLMTLLLYKLMRCGLQLIHNDHILLFMSQQNERTNLDLFCVHYTCIIEMVSSDSINKENKSETYVALSALKGQGCPAFHSLKPDSIRNF